MQFNEEANQNNYQARGDHYSGITATATADKTPPYASALLKAAQQSPANVMPFSVQADTQYNNVDTTNAILIEN